MRTISSYNRRKLDELPFHYHYLHDDLVHSQYLNDVSWIYDKLCGSNVFQLLEDIHLVRDTMNQSTALLKDFLERHASLLSYDGRQFYSHIYSFLKGRSSEGVLKIAFEACMNPPVLCLVPISPLSLDGDGDQPAPKKMFDLLVRIPNSNRFIVAVSTEQERICVWDIVK